MLKNIRNNWCTEKSQKLKYFDIEKNTTAIACWRDLVAPYKKESEGIVKQTTLSFSALYPTNFEKQKVSLALQVFNEKTVAALEIQGSMETARFIQLVLRMWKILNIKSPDKWYMPYDEDRKPFKNIDDQRLAFIKSMATMFKSMDTYSASTKTREMGLTTDTSNALYITLNGIINLIPILLTKMRYILTAEFQSDRIEGEFGIYRQLSGGNFHIPCSRFSIVLICKS